MKKLNTKNIFFISDLHAGVHANSSEWMEIQESYFNEYLIPLLKNNMEPDDILVILGDIFESQQLLNVKVLNIVLGIIKKLSDFIPVHIILGNHDTYLKSTNDINSIKIFNNINNVFIYESPEEVEISKKKFLFFPWHTDRTNERQAIQDHTDLDYLFCHTDFIGFSYNRFVKSPIGNSPSDFSQFKRVFSGHIHWRQESGNVTMVGSPYALTRGDVDNVKGVYRLDVKNDETYFYPNNHSPKYQASTLSNILEMTFGEYQKYITNNFVDITDSDMWGSFPVDKLRDMSGSARKFEMNNLPPKIDVDEFEVNQAQIMSLDFLRWADVYVDNLGTKKVMKKKLLVKFKELYELSQGE